MNRGLTLRLLFHTSKKKKKPKKASIYITIKVKDFENEDLKMVCSFTPTYFFYLHFSFLLNNKSKRLYTKPLPER